MAIDASNVQEDLFQLQNTGRARFAGAEAAFDYRPAAFLELGANYSYIDQQNLDDPDLRFANVPRHKIFAYASGRIAAVLTLRGSVEFNSERYSTSYGTTADAFTVTNLSGRADLRPWLGLEGGVNNIFDANYALIEGFPEEGRNFFITLLFQRP